MRRPALQMLFFLIVMVSILLMMADVPTAAQSPTGVTPTIGVGPGTPVPVGGQLAMIDRGAVLQAAFGLLIWPAVALVMLVGLVGFIVVRRRESV